MTEVDFSKYPSVNFRLSEQFDRLLTERGENRNAVAKRDLSRYYETLARNLPTFSINESLFLCGALNGVKCSPDTLYGNIAASDEFASPEKWGVETAEPFITRIRNLSYIEALAVIDAVERVWNAPEYRINLKQRVLLVGLAR